MYYMQITIVKLIKLVVECILVKIRAELSSISLKLTNSELHGII